MQQVFNYRTLFAYLLLLAFILLLRWPSFHPNFVGTSEAAGLISGQRIADGGAIYQDAWEIAPPLLLWFYAAFDAVFGQYALFALRVFCCFYIFLTAYVVNLLAYAYHNRGASLPVAPGFLYALLVSVPWTAQETSAELLINLPASVSFLMIVQYVVNERKRWNLLFWAGALCGVCFGLKYQSLLHALALLTAFTLVAPLRLRDITTFAGGLLFVVVGMMLPMYFQGAFPAWWDVGLLFWVDYLKYETVFRPPAAAAPYLEMALYWGMFAILSLWGFLAFRSRFYSMAIKVRRAETMLRSWLVFTIAAVLLGGKQFQPQYVALLAPCMAFYLSYLFWTKKNLLIKRAAFATGAAAPAAALALYFLLVSPQLQARVLPGFEDTRLGRRLYDEIYLSPDEAELARALDEIKPLNGMLVAWYAPRLYARLGQPCASKYGSFRVAYFKMDWLPQNFQRSGLASKSEELADVHRSFLRESPDVVVDVENVFSEIRSHLPRLQKYYVPFDAGAYRVYARRDLAPSDKQP